MRIFNLLLIFALVLSTLPGMNSACAQSAFAPPADPGPSSLNRDQLLTIGIFPHIGNSIPQHLNFTNSKGQTIDFSTLVARKPTLLALVYFQCPNLCTLVLNGMVESVADLKRDVGDGYQIVVVSIDPKENAELAAEKKKTYLRRYSRGQNADQDWTFLVGDQANIAKLAASVGYQYRYDPAIHQYAHGSGIMMLSPSGKIVQYFLGIEYSPASIEQSIQLANGGSVGTPAEQYNLLCYCYNPLIGPYGAVIFNLLRLAGGITVAVLAVFIARQIYIELKRGRVT